MLEVPIIIENVIPIAELYGLKKVYIFGSYAKGTATEESDVDLLIVPGKRMSLIDLSGLRQDLIDALNVSVDIVTNNAIDDDFRKSIDECKELIFDEKQ